ncbi:MAG TPA: 2OG-Fe(II) oxygenase, partial [Thermoanaerobaculia bacterium]|nr:2OG-Fe(II) oxygenase [Thermoanaerobaculia bacterium]
PPDRLVYLLDHQYTERGFGWRRLKGDDAARAAALRSAAERAGCEVFLALAEVHETWNCFEPGWDEPRYGRRRSWSRDEDDEWEAEYELPSADDPDAYDLQELLDSEITLDRWLDPSGKKAEPVATPVGRDELCFSTPSSALEPYASEYEGYMGNWGNTMDRWYRRAAVVLWPRERDFAVRAEASPAWALEELEKRLKAGGVAEAREMAGALLPFWKAVARTDGRRGVFARALRVAHDLDRPELATFLIEPFRVEELTPAGAKAFAALVERYGEGWLRALLAGWSGRGRQWAPEGRDRPAWLALLPRLSEALCLADEAAGPPAARLLLEDSWAWLRGEIEARRRYERPAFRDEALGKLAPPLLAVLESAGLLGADDLRDEAVAFFSTPENELLVPCLVRALRAAAETVEPALWPGAGLEALGEHCIRALQAQLEEPPRAEDDWSIALPEGCRCELCQTLGAFLADPGRTLLEWPIAKDKRRHVHGRLDAHELPVTHETHRKGSPYTLILTKTEALFEREAATRRTRQADLAWLTAQE